MGAEEAMPELSSLTSSSSSSSSLIGTLSSPGADPTSPTTSSASQFTVCPPAALPPSHWASVLQRRLLLKESGSGSSIGGSSGSSRGSGPSDVMAVGLPLAAFAPHVSLSYGAPLPKQAFDRAAQTFASFPSPSLPLSGAAALPPPSLSGVAGGGGGGNSSSSSNSESDAHCWPKGYLLGRDLEFGSLECGQLALVCCEGPDWRCWTEVARFDVSAKGRGSAVMRK